MTLQDFLVWLMAGGSVIALSWLLEPVAWFQALEPLKKKLIQAAGSALIAILAKVVIEYVPVTVLEQISKYFELIAAIFVSVFLNQVAHKVNLFKK